MFNTPIKELPICNLPWFVQLWHAPGFSEFAVGFVTALATLVGGIGVAIYMVRHERKRDISGKKKQVAEDILRPFTDVLLGFEEVDLDKKKNLPLMAQAVITPSYVLKNEKKELRRQINRALTLAKLYTPNYIHGPVFELSGWSLGILENNKIDEGIYNMIKESIDDLSENLIKWIESGEIKGKDWDFEDVVKKVEEKEKKKPRK